MGEKETMAPTDAGRRLAVSGNPGGSATAGVISAAVSSVGQLAGAGEADKNAANPTYATPGLAGDMPTI